MRWPKCESVSKVCRKGTQAVSPNRLLFCSFFGQLRWKVPGVPLMQVSPLRHRGLVQHQCELERRWLLSVQLHSSGRPPWNTHVLFLPLHTTLAVWLSHAWHVALKLWFRKTGERQLFLCSPLLSPSASRSHVHQHVHTHTYIYLQALNQPLLDTSTGNSGIWLDFSQFSMENLNGESSGALNVWWVSVILHRQTSQACSALYNICSTKQTLNGFSGCPVGSGRGDTHTRPNLSFKATLQATCLTLLLPSFPFLCLSPLLVDLSLLTLCLFFFSTSVFSTTSAFSPPKAKTCCLAAL